MKDGYLKDPKIKKKNWIDYSLSEFEPDKLPGKLLGAATSKSLIILCELELAPPNCIMQLKFFLIFAKTNNLEKKEFYRHQLPHFQVPGQVFFVTWCLKSAVPPKALAKHKQQLINLKSEILYAQRSGKDVPLIEKLKMQHRIARKKYVKAYDDLLDLNNDLSVDLSCSPCVDILREALLFFEAKKIENFAFSIMPNHVHWVVRTFEVGEDGNPVYLQDILQSVKRFSSNRINKVMGTTGILWQKESFDTTIRDEKHLWTAMEYALNNPVKAGLASSPEDWKGNWVKTWV